MYIERKFYLKSLLPVQWIFNEMGSFFVSILLFFWKFTLNRWKLQDEILKALNASAETNRREEVFEW